MSNSIVDLDVSKVEDALWAAIHLAEGWYEAQGLTDDEVVGMNLTLATAEDLTNLLRYPVKSPGVVIPYPGENYVRARMLGEIASDRKYSSGLNSGCTPPYLPAIMGAGGGLTWDEVKQDVTVPIVTTEGEVKAHWGCKTGAVVVGLGGVDAIATLFTSGWVWEGRLVNVCFDHDAGQEPGRYKSNVAGALGRLCSRLIAEGAIVNVIHVGLVAKDVGVVGKCGLDDYLRAGGTWPALLTTAAPAPEWCEMLGEMLTDCIYVVGTNHTHVFNLSDGSRKAPSDFHDAHIEKKRIVVDNDGKGKVRQVSNIWMEHPSRQTAQGYDLNPQRDHGFLPDYYPNGRGVINLWQGYPQFPLGSDLRTEFVQQEWQRFMEGLFGEHWQWVGLWAAHILNRPWERSTQAVLVLSMIQGLGKSLFGDVLRDLTGPHGLEGKSSRMFSKFNAEQEAKTLIVVNELDMKFSAREGQLNDLLTEEVVATEAKGKDVISLPNLRRWYFTTNTSSPCRLSKGQRRVLIVTPPRIVKDTRGDWGNWVREVVARFRRSPEDLAAVRKWFDDLWGAYLADGNEWDPTAQVPVTQAALDAAEASMTTMQIVAEHLFEWMQEQDGGWAAAHPDLKKRDVKMFGELTSLVTSHGGQVGQKTIKEDGVLKYYTVYDIAKNLDSSVNPTNHKRTLKVDPDEARTRAVGLAAEYIKVQEIVLGKG